MAKKNHRQVGQSNGAKYRKESNVFLDDGWVFQKKHEWLLLVKGFYMLKKKCFFTMVTMLAILLLQIGNKEKEKR
jgi:hypothetical protein